MKENSKPITKAVIAVAGWGTRFLPATKNQSKQMLPIIDKPIVQHVVEEAVSSGIKDIIIVTQAGHTHLEDHFDTHVELERVLEENCKWDLLEKIKNIPEMANFVYVRQSKHLPYGNGTSLLSAAPLIDNDESFVYMFGDDLVLPATNADGSPRPCTQQLLDVFYQTPNCDGVIAAQQVSKEEISRYGIVKYKKDNGQFEALIEKPSIKDAPSNLANFGRYVLNYKTIEALKEQETGHGGELWLVDAITKVAKRGGNFIVHEIQGKWVTTGDPLSYLKAIVEFALVRPDLSKDFKKYLREKVGN
jgi:UTP--glucose-1-phosphate uridylyltransferase